ncbi:MAG: hypothetical protein Q7T17_10360 [Microbacterium sp.]|uniref:hypothetical protein n=1 Tax=Microbacterium sp. TaxID=51671 RepID=UPI00271A8AAC|nr:hypothetical protein [Microbacterium sp.]MDO8383368.1 hypothetical protein [Microbacterium sp.]
MSKQQPDTLQLGGTPRADLLPASAREAIRRRPIVRRLILGLSLLALLVILAIVGATALSFLAQAQLQAERDRSETLLAQQLEFAEARAIDAALTESTNSRLAVTSVEIDWEALLGEVRATLPAGVLLTSVDGEITDGDSPDAGEATGETEGEPVPLRQDSVASIRINATSPTVPDVEAWLADLESVTGFAGIAPPTSVVGSEGASYTVTIEFLLNEEAFLGRYAPEATDAEEED